MDKLVGFLVALAAGAFGIAGFAAIMSAVCGRYNEQCGGSLQLWQGLFMAGILLAPQIAVWYVTRRK